MMRSHRSRGALLAASILGTLAVLAACAEANRDDASPHEERDAEAAATLDATAEASERISEGGLDVDAAPSNCSAGGFCWTDVPGDESLRGVWGDGQGVVWSVSAEGHVFSWDGTKWTTRFTATGALYAVWGSSPTDLWVGGEEGLFHGTGPTSATISWSPVAALPGDETVPILSLWGVGADDVWAVGGTDEYEEHDDTGHVGKSRILHFGKSADGGPATWSYDPLSHALYESSNRGLFIRKVWGSASGDVWLGGDAYGGPELPSYESVAIAFHRRPSNSGWTEIGVPQDASSKATKIIRLYAGTTDGERVWIGVLRSAGSKFVSSGVGSSVLPTDGGAATWQQTAFPSWVSDANDLWASSPNDVWYAAPSLVMRFDGARWEAVPISTTALPIKKTYWDIWGSGPDDVWIVGDGIAVHRGPSR